MSDIKQYIGDENVDDPDKADRLWEIADWDESVAESHAAEEHLTLTDAHWDLLRFLREHYVEHGRTSARELTRVLEKRYADRGGLRYLYTLFPNGPIHQGSRLAGVPEPGDAVDSSFGSVR